MKLTNFFEGHPEIKNLKVVLTDLNGVFRGKKIPISQIYKIENGNLLSNKNYLEYKDRLDHELKIIIEINILVIF